MWCLCLCSVFAHALCCWIVGWQLSAVWPSPNPFSMLLWVALFLPSLALMLAFLPLFAVATYTTQLPGTWCFLPIHGPHSTADTNLALAFSCPGLAALTLFLLCNILSGLALLQAGIKPHDVNIKPTARRTYHPSSASTPSLFCLLDVEVMAQLTLITVVSMRWGPSPVSTTLLDCRICF